MLSVAHPHNKVQSVELILCLQQLTASSALITHIHTACGMRNALLVS